MARGLARIPYPARLALAYVIGLAISFAGLDLARPSGASANDLGFAFALVCLFGLPYAVSWFLFALFYQRFVVTRPLEIAIIGTVLVGATRFVSLRLPSPDRPAATLRADLSIAAVAAIFGLVVLLVSTGAEVLIARRAKRPRYPMTL
jgi:hypothetical protein